MNSEQPIPVLSRETSSGEVLVDPSPLQQPELERSCKNVSNDCVLIEDVTSQEEKLINTNGNEQFEFTDLGPNWLPTIQTNRDLNELLVQWGVLPHLILRKFRVCKGLLDTDEAIEASLLLDFFNSETVQAALREGAIKCEGDCGSPSGRYGSVEWETLGSSVIHTSFFDRLKDEDVRILGPSGGIKPDMDAQYDGATSCNRLQEMFLNEGSENQGCFDEKESKELILKLLRLVSVGGTLCQPEENIAKYITVVKMLYKEMVSVQREESSGEIKVVSKAYTCTGLDGSHNGLFAKDNSNNACYVTIDKRSRMLTFLSFSFVPYW